MDFINWLFVLAMICAALLPAAVAGCIIERWLMRRHYKRWPNDPERDYLPDNFHHSTRPNTWFIRRLP